jgi:RHS repeat-associated protein
VVTYAVITTADAQDPQKGPTYSDPNVLGGAAAYFITPLRVVASISAEDGLANGTMFTTTYRYQSLRASTLGRGPQGFAKITVIDGRAVLNTNPLLHRITETNYFQYYPFTGLPGLVVHSIGHTDPAHPDVPVVLSTTATGYCDTTVANAAGDPRCLSQGGGTAPYPAGTSLFVYPLTVTDRTILYEGDVTDNHPTDSTTVTTEYRYDSAGNPIKTIVTAEMQDGACQDGIDCPTHQKKIENFYDGNGGDVSTADLQRLGKATLTVVTTQSLVPPGNPIVHTTGFRYFHAPVTISPQNEQPYEPIALLERVVEPNAGVPIEEHTAYSYDEFGNVVVTKDCASDFDSCHIGNALGPPDLPFRITSVSYDPAFFTPPAGARVTALSYGKGRFPVRTTNALGHVEYTAYDPVFGGLLQRTGPNGIHTCHVYDNFGRETTAIERCGSSQEQQSTITAYLAKTGDPAGAKVVIVTHDPAGVGTWSYNDAFGRTIVTRGRSFDGGFTETTKVYDQWARLAQESAPRIIGSDDPVFETVTTYDSTDRVTQVTRDLGVIDRSGTPKHSIETISYHGTLVHTDHNLDGEDLAHLFQRPRDETKGVLGKVVLVTDAKGAQISYTYDADGNLTDTFDGANTVHVEYDSRGRKLLTRDPDLGQWTYGYNGYGDLVSQTDAIGQEIDMTYDVLGRMTSKTDAAGTASWVYDVAPLGATGKLALGKLAATVSAPDQRLLGACAAPYGLPSDGNRAVRSYSYTDFAQLQDDTACTDGDTFTTTTSYDPLGRLSLIRYPEVNDSRLSLVYSYTRLGFLYFITDAADASLYWAGTARDARGQVTTEQTGNGVETRTTRAPATGWTLGSKSISHADSDNLIQGWSYTFDEVGNLRSRSRARVGGTSWGEVFTYDALDRLGTSDFAGGGSHFSESYSYDNFGNLLLKGDKVYTYGDCAAGPHAVCTVDGSAPYQYDGNGNLRTGGGRRLRYDTANKPLHIENDNSAVDFIYGSDRNRIVQIAGPLGGADDTRTVYVGLGATGKSMYERTTHAGTTEHTHFLYAGDVHGGGAFAVKVVRPQPAGTSTITTASYYHFDHLGSITAISDDAGRVVTPDWGGNAATVMSYDPWGARRDPVAGQPADPASFAPQPGHREYTGHEVIPDVGLVNMNGRVYDPVLGRFLTPDPNVQFVADLQSYNRYSYVHNNPLRYTDPTGYFSFGIGGVGGFLWSATMGLAVTAACASSAGAACVVGTIMLVAYSTSTMAMSGASFANIVESTALGMAAGMVGGVAGGALASGLGGGLGAQIVGGAVSGMVSNVLSTVVMHGSLGWRDLLLSAASGAVSAGVAAGMQGTNQVSEASAEEAQGGGGSGESAAEASSRDQAAGARRPPGVLVAGDDLSVLGKGNNPDGGVPDASIYGQSGNSANECDDLRDRITNRTDELTKRMVDLREDKLKLPPIGIKNHQDQFEWKQLNLRRMINSYNTMNCPDPLPEYAWSRATMAVPEPSRGPQFNMGNARPALVPVAVGITLIAILRWVAIVAPAL